METQYKICTSCGKELPIEAFYLRKSGIHAGKYTAKCKECVKSKSSEYRKANPDKVKACLHANYLKNQEHRKEDARARYAANPLAHNERSRAYHAAHRESIKVAKQEYYAQNRDVILAKDREYKKRNAERYRVTKREYARRAYYAPVPADSSYSVSLAPYEELRNSDEGMLEVKCAYCGKWHGVTYGQAKTRLDAINGYRSLGSEFRFYCSDACKNACPVFWLKTFGSNDGTKKVHSREVQPQLRQLVLARDNYTCQKCGKGTDAELHCHHIDPVVNNPIESADMNNCITVCKDCHKELHHLPGCGLGELKCAEAIGF